MTESVLNIELHPNFFAYAVKSPQETLYSKAHIEHLTTISENGKLLFAESKNVD